jgi:hypothetical protein
MKRIALVPALLALASCGTPQQECIRMVSRDLIVVDRLITETQGNLARGYAYEQKVITVPAFINCTPRATEANPNPRPATCFDEESRTITRPVAIDLAAEQVKLNGLQAKRSQLARAAQPAVAECQARYPE